MEPASVARGISRWLCCSDVQPCITAADAKPAFTETQVEELFLLMHLEQLPRLLKYFDILSGCAFDWSRTLPRLTKLEMIVFTSISCTRLVPLLPVIEDTGDHDHASPLTYASPITQVESSLSDQSVGTRYFQREYWLLDQKILSTSSRLWHRTWIEPMDPMAKGSRSCYKKQKSHGLEDDGNGCGGGFSDQDFVRLTRLLKSITRCLIAEEDATAWGLQIAHGP